MKQSSISSTTPLKDHSQIGEMGQTPSHIAIIMDGNGRWAKKRGLPRVAGHKEGVEALRRTVEACKSLSVQHLTVFSFSTENWRRPKSEVSALFGLLKLYVEQDLKRLNKEGVRIRIVGSLEGLESDIVCLLKRCQDVTKNNNAFNINIAFNYGGRAEIVEATKSIVEDVKNGKLSEEDICEEALRERMWTRELPDVDLLLRTSGELRVSNFLLWGIAYAELMFVDVHWPDFGRDELEAAVQEFKNRTRRYGGVVTKDVLSVK